MCFLVVQAESEQIGYSRVETRSFVAQPHPWGLSTWVNSGNIQTVVVGVLVVAAEVVDFIVEGIGIVFD